MTDHRYFEELAAALRAAGVPAGRVTATVAELTGYLAETGTPATEEFGPVAEFAARLAGPGAPDGPADDAEVWRWTADIYADRRLLNEYGAQGWEVERVDRMGLFVSRRVPGAAMRWEYRREATRNGGERTRVTAELAADGWEPCGQWLASTYFKRPAAATVGPAAALASAPGRPRRRLFLSRRVRVGLGVWLLVVAGLVAVPATGGIDTTRSPFLAGLLVGAVAAGAGGVWGVRHQIIKGVEG